MRGKTSSKICSKCNTMISMFVYNRHANSCKGIPVVRNSKKLFSLSEEFKRDDGKYNCPHCEKIFSKNGMISHIFRKHTKEGIEFRTKHDPNIGFKNGTRVSWNKGLTKYSSENIKIVE